MKKPVVDYRTFRLSKIGDPQFSHLKLLLGWVGYFILFFLTETLIPAERCFPVHCWLDDLIPFCEIFVIPYVFWYFLIVISLGYFLLYHVESFVKLQTYLIIIQIIAMAIYILLPTRQDLRPVEFPRDNFLTQCVGLLYRIDTNTGVCPSMHVAFSLGIASVWLKEQDIPGIWKGFVALSAIVICLSTMFIKQHSAVDFLMAIPVCIVAEYFVFGKSYWFERIKNNNLHTQTE